MEFQFGRLMKITGQNLYLRQLGFLLGWGKLACKRLVSHYNQILTTLLKMKIILKQGFLLFFSDP